MQFMQFSDGGSSVMQVFGNGNLDISGHKGHAVRIGALEGDGLVFLGAFNLSVGTNGSSTSFSGVIQDGGTSGGADGVATQDRPGTLAPSVAPISTRAERR